MTPHPYRLRPYHNPHRVDESAVPDGWRMRYEDEMSEDALSKCRCWRDYGNWSKESYYRGILFHRTYIVPVNETTNTTER